ncbi:MAG: folylpolyglutamate synthase/dihydrofolate synthase family protein [Opitutaceae bacterium]
MNRSPDLIDYPAVRDYLFSLKHHGAKFGIDRMRLLSERLGHPERAYPVVHIAGTNGKGSVAAMVDSILRQTGLKVGLFTSPHLVRQGERIQVNREILHENEIVAYTRELQHVAEAMARIDPEDHPSFFEFMTAMAFLHFARARVDVGVIEVGLGGRLDATNVVRPAVTAITSIGLDHCEILGDTIARIAAEKAGIIKSGIPLVLGQVPDEAEDVIRSVCLERGSPLFPVDEHFGEHIDDYPRTNLEGDYQRINAGTATLICRRLTDRFEIPEAALKAGLGGVSWPGRWQRMEVGGRHLILDAAHNVDAAAWLAANLAHLVALNGCKPKVVVGCLGRPRAVALLAVLAEYAAELFLVVPHQPRATGFGELETLVPEGFPGIVHRSNLAQLFPSPGDCSVGAPGDTVLVTGSIYLLGEVMERLHFAESPNQGMLQDG